MRILLLFAHPALHLSRVHARLIPLAKSAEHVTFHDLYAEYPDDFIFAKKEQALLDKHDVVLMQFPFFWFSTPGILKNWQDIVLEYGYAFGEGGKALKGKYFGVITSTGGRDYIFQRGQGFRFAVRDYLMPLESMANLCGMKYLPPFVIHDSRRIDEEKLDLYARNYRFYLDTLPSVKKHYGAWKRAVNVNSVLFVGSANEEDSDD
ncbi:NAD(P)H-dependent oxidoreductase [Suttonella ornithocola]|uniref:General stress protein 14 n=1 Tax=Suttonella ornithocola TaxID=279832 RepID=A0A380ML94_9GAMM|nr:NAD(P)H-dependent oxidoreductase [Suttonella ornithocola]SUO93415.1 General stress protein 14 [Suttonella ornithocola]